MTTRSPPLFTSTIVDDVRKLPKIQKFDLISKIWPASGLLEYEFDERAYDTFFQYLGEEQSQLRQHQSKFGAATLESSIGLIETLCENRSESLASILEMLKKEFINADVNCIRRSLELTVRLWLALNLNSWDIAFGPVHPYDRAVEWPVDDAFNTFLENQFQPVQQLAVPTGCLKIDSTFTAAYLVNVCGIKLHWSNYLSDHLKLNRRGRVLTVYKHKICLLNHLKATDGCPIAKSTLEEALDTLNLLFPFACSSTRQLLFREGMGAFYCLGNCNRHRQLDLTQYKRWRGELQDIIEMFNEPPRSWKQLISDRRNMMDWAAFWIAVMVFLLALVGIPCSIVQTVYTVKGYRLAFSQVNGN